jgi:hypothetical protein
MEGYVYESHPEKDMKRMRRIEQPKPAARQPKCHCGKPSLAFGQCSAHYQKARYYHRPGEREMRQAAALKRYYEKTT